MKNKQSLNPSPGNDRILRCRRCGKCVDCSPEDLMNHMRDGWPKCCRETMTLFIEAKLPGGTNS
jgi:hypothetical protein